MKRKLFRAVPIAVLAAAAVAGGVLLWTQPWSDDTPVEQAAARAEYGFCDVFISDVPADVHVTASRIPDLLIDGVGAEGIVVAFVPSPDGDPETSPHLYSGSYVSIDAQTGEITQEQYRTPADEVRLKALLATLRVGPWEPAGPAWPRTDTPPTGELGEILRPFRVPADDDEVALTYHKPEPGSGMLASPVPGVTPEGWMSRRLVAYTCDSVVEIDAETGEVIRREVVPGEEAMFQRFMNEVEVLPAVSAERGSS